MEVNIDAPGIGVLGRMGWDRGYYNVVVHFRVAGVRDWVSLDQNLLGGPE